MVMQNKKLRNIFALSALVALFGLTSCVDDDYQETFSVSISGYVLQHEVDSCSVFTPYMFISSNSSTFKLQDAKVYGTNSNVFELEENNEYVYRTTGLDNYDKVSTLNGTYTFMGIAKTGEQATGTFKFDFAEGDTLGALEVISLERVGSSIQAKVKKVINGKYLGFVVTPFDNEETPTRWSNYYKVVATNPIYTSDNELTISMPFETYNLATDKASIQVFAANDKSVYIESMDFRIYNKATDKFE